MAATRGQHIQDRCQRDATRQHLLCRPNREAGAKRYSWAERFAREQPEF
jgi:hypothetical protein